MDLPGIGRNTAHAIAAFAYRQPVAILEANVKRIVARVFAWEKPTDAQLWAGAEALLNAKQPFDYNQAMMDLGSLICTPRNPDCPACPAAATCKGKTAPQLYPAPKAKKATPVREVTITVRRDAAGRLCLEKRSDALLGGLYGFPQTSLASFPRRRDLSVAKDAISNSCLSESSQTVQTSKRSSTDWIPACAEMKALGTVTHTYSHFKLIGHVMIEEIGTRMNSPGWYLPEEILALPLSGVDHKVLALVAQRNTRPKPAPKAPRKGRAR